MRTWQGNRFIFVVTDRLTKLTRAVTVAKVTVPHVAAMSLENLITPIGTPDIILTDNGKKFTSKFFAALWASMGTKFVTTTVYHLPTNGQVARYNRTLVTKLRHSIDELRGVCAAADLCLQHAAT